MLLSPRQQYRAAFHEAGHACTLLAGGHTFDAVKIYRRPTAEDRIGRTWVERHIPNPKQRIVAALSGAVAEHYATGIPIDELLDGARSDFAIAQDAWRELPQWDKPSLNDMLARTARIVNLDWPKIEVLASGVARLRAERPSRGRAQSCLS